jgi:hypothetical protein
MLPTLAKTATGGAVSFGGGSIAESGPARPTPAGTGKLPPYYFHIIDPYY